VAQLAFDDAPIMNGATPEASDKLAQRNLQVTRSDNPGPASSHRVPQTFDIRPSSPVALSIGDPSTYPDELMIDWGAIPAGSVASIYWPGVLTSDVIALAGQMYGTHTLAAADANTIPVIGSPPSTRHAGQPPVEVDQPKAEEEDGPLSWRYVVGTFQVKIPVSNPPAMRADEESTLAIMKWRLQEMSPSNKDRLRLTVTASITAD
jgi:hypothetical protein